MKRRLLIGKIVGTHGVMGDIKLLSHADDATILFRPEGLYTDETSRDRLVLSLKSHPKPTVYVINVRGVGSMDAAEKLRGTDLYIDREDLPALDEGYYHVDLEGMNVQSGAGDAIGKVIRVENFGAGDLLDVQTPGGKTRLVPFFSPYLVAVDMDARLITVDEPEVM